MYGALIVNPSAVGAAAFFAMGFDVVVTELANLASLCQCLARSHTGSRECRLVTTVVRMRVSGG